MNTILCRFRLHAVANTLIFGFLEVFFFYLILIWRLFWYLLRVQTLYCQRPYMWIFFVYGISERLNQYVGIEEPSPLVKWYLGESIRGSVCNLFSLPQPMQCFKGISFLNLVANLFRGSSMKKKTAHGINSKTIVDLHLLKL